MEIKTIIQSQHHASLEMLRQAIENCPADLWVRSTDQNPTWRLAYRALFYTHLYLTPSEQEFRSWDKHRNQSQFFGRLPWPPHDIAAEVEPYTIKEVIEYLDAVEEQFQGMIEQSDLNGPSGFDWQPFSKLELQLYNLRHLQQHIGELYERLGVVRIELPWIGSVS